MHEIGQGKVFIRDPDGIELNRFGIFRMAPPLRGAWENKVLEVDRFFTKESHYGILENFCKKLRFPGFLPC